ncbi:MAG: hypothetical protein ACRDU8_05240 [Egibacteraceae bacterium]
MEPDERREGAPPPDDGADTERFRAFAERRDTEPARAAGAPFRIVTLLIGLVVFAGLVVLLLKL